VQLLHDLGIDFRVLLVNALAFLVVLYLLTRFFFRPFGTFLEERRSAIQQQMSEAEQARKDAAAQVETMRAEQQTARDQLAREAEAFRKQAREEAQKIVADAHQAALERKDQAEADLARQREELEQALSAETAALAGDMARKALTLSLLPQDQDSAVEAALGRVEQLSRENPN